MILCQFLRLQLFSPILRVVFSSWASLVAQMVKVTEDVGSILGLDDSLEKEMATHSNILV